MHQAINLGRVQFKWGSDQHDDCSKLPPYECSSQRAKLPCTTASSVDAQKFQHASAPSNTISHVAWAKGGEIHKVFEVLKCSIQGPEMQQTSTQHPYKRVNNAAVAAAAGEAALLPLKYRHSSVKPQPTAKGGAYTAVTAHITEAAVQG